MASNFPITGNETIAEILDIFPESSEILFAHGLGCVGCQFGAFETLKNGVLGHGFSEEEFTGILADINEAAQDLNLF